MNTPNLKPNARKIFDLRYPRKNEDGTPAETPAEVVERVALNVASVNALYVPLEMADHDHSLDVEDVGEFPAITAKRQWRWLNPRDARAKGRDTLFALQMNAGWGRVDAQADKYRALLADLSFLPNSPTWTGAGTPLGQLAACFVLPVEDDLGRGPDSIMAILHKATLIQQTGGGNGFSFGRLRPSGALVHRSMGKASGPLGFATMYDATFRQIAQGGSRRGANMLVMPVWHPDINAFIEAKVEEGKLDQFNFSVGVTDEFMVAVEGDSDFELRFGGDYYETIRARDLWDRLVSNAWVIGDPGVLFLDKANAQNPSPTRYVLEATNPCGEQYLPAYSNCCLGSISLGNFVTEWGTSSEHGTFDWDAFREVVVTATEFLDDVVSANQYVPEVPELEAAAMGERRIGLGLMGLADTLLKLGLNYGTEEGLAFASQVTEFARYWTMMTSIQRAKERGPFEWIENSIYDPDLMRSEGAGAPALQGIDGKTHSLWCPPSHLNKDYIEGYDFGRPDVYWSNVTNGIIEHGIRNACQWTFAPTGTISNVAGLEGSGCEPLFALVYQRTVMQEGENVVLHYLSDLFLEALERARAWEQRGMMHDAYIEAVIEAVRDNDGSCQGVDLVPTDIQDVFVVASDLTGEQHVWMQATLQAFVDNSISKTINLPNEATIADVDRIYRLAYSLGCKGITIYRQGSRALEVLATTVDTEGHITDWPEITPLAIPSYSVTDGLDAKVYPVETFFGKVQVTITRIEGHPNRPFDVRLQIGKGGNDKNADVEALGRIVSLALRSGVRVSDIVGQLEHIGGATSYGLGERKVRSVADGLAKLLRRIYLQEETEAGEITSPVGSTKLQISQGDVCPQCLQATLVVEAGCKHCDVRLGGCGEYEGCD